MDIDTAEIVLRSGELAATLAYFTERLGFRVDAIHPADSPRIAVISGHGVRIRLDPDAADTGVVRVRSGGAASGSSETAPNGTLVQFVDPDPPVEVPAMIQSEVLVRAGDEWSIGRAGMQYRDLVPGRLGGRFVASHIRIPTPGPVPDYVHFHKIRFQMIFCRRGAVRLAYEDQGDEFVLSAGDCVLQPPRIRHRVLEVLEPLEVIEIGCPAEHETIADHAMEPPTGRTLPERDFGGQRFVRHVAATGGWAPWGNDGLEARDTGISHATGGLAGAWTVRPLADHAGERTLVHDGEFLFCYVLSGALRLGVNGQTRELAADDSIVVPAPSRVGFDGSADLEVLVVRLPG